MKIHNFSPITGEYVSTTDARIDPLETAVQGRDVFLIPANATTIDPPANIPQGQAPVFAAGAWAMTDDHRGEKWFDANGNEVTIDEIGTLAKHTKTKPVKVRKFSDVQNDAALAHAASDAVILQFYEAGVAVPKAWRDYRVSLRALKAAKSGDPATALPVQPAIPPNI